MKFIRDTTARRDKTARAKRDFVKNEVAAVKRKAPSSSGISCVATFSGMDGQTPADFSSVCSELLL